MPVQRISPPLRGSARAFTLMELLLVFVILTVLIIFSVSISSRVSMQSKRVKCLSNMRQVAGALLRYSAENRNAIVPAVILLPPAYTSGKTWMVYMDETGMLPKDSYHEKPHGVMTCPARDRPGSYVYNQTHYAINRNMGFDNVIRQGTPFHRMSRVKNLRETLLLGESEGDYMIQSHSAVFLEYENREKRKIAFPHQETANLIFMDGHAEVGRGPWKIPKTGDSYPFYGQ